MRSGLGMMRKMRSPLPGEPPEAEDDVDLPGERRLVEMVKIM